jgi:hypothetical protein
MAYFESNDPDAMKHMRSMFGPQQVDHQFRQAIQFCWMSLPPDRQNIDELEKEIRRISERALQNLREDWKSFDFETPPSSPPPQLDP